MLLKPFRAPAISAAFIAFITLTAPLRSEPGPTPGSLATITLPTPPPLPAPPPEIGVAAPEPTPPPPPPPIPTAAPIRQTIQLGPSATVLLPTTEVAITTNVNGIFGLVALPQNQIVQVTVHYASTDPATWNAAQAAQIVRIEALDGGAVAAVVPSVGGITPPVEPTFISTPPLPAIGGTVSANGNLTFIFQAGHLPGLYQIRLHRGNEVLGMQFWIRDPQNPANDPPAITPSHNLDLPSPNPI